LDIGGAEGMTDVVSATAGLVIARGTDAAPGYEKDTPVSPRYDRVYVLDGRGWICGYVHLLSIDPGIRLGEPVAVGQKIGVLSPETISFESNGAMNGASGPSRACTSGSIGHSRARSRSIPPRPHGPFWHHPFAPVLPWKRSLPLNAPAPAPPRQN
jgi:hypothetical protein